MTMTTCPDSCSPAAAEEISVYEAIGGRAAVAAAVDNFYGRLLDDPELALFFPGGVGTRHRAFVVTILGEALGGPERYRGLAVTLAELGVPRHLADHIVAVVAGLRPAVVTA